MRTVELTLDRRPRSEFAQRRASRHDATLVLDGGTVGLLDGQPVLAQIDASDLLDLDLLRRVCHAIDYRTAPRAAGVTTNAMPFGFRPRLPQYARPWCGVTDFTITHPDLSTVLERAGHQVEALYQAHSPDRYQRHLDQAQTIDPAWRMGGGIHTQGIVNNTTALGYHYDGGNFAGVWSTMLVLRGNTTGGCLVIPELGVSLDCPDGHVVMFDGQTYAHGVSPIIVPDLTSPAYRYSIVWYGLKAMGQCTDDELTRGRRSRQATEQARAAADRAQS